MKGRNLRIIQGERGKKKTERETNKFQEEESSEEEGEEEQESLC